MEVHVQFGDVGLQVLAGGHVRLDLAVEVGLHFALLEELLCLF
jgi:hypothetical protein